MTKEELFRKYKIDETHSEWDSQIDNWMSVEIYRIMHGGNLPEPGDASVGWITEFMDKTNDIKFMMTLMARKEGDWGSLYLTGSRMIYRFSDEILKSINQ